MRCIHCGINIQQLKSVADINTEWLHVEPGDPPYRECKARKRTAEPDTIGRWAGRLLDQLDTKPSIEGKTK